MIFSVYALLVYVAITTTSNIIPSVGAQLTTNDLSAKVTAKPPPGYNIDGGSVFTNFVSAFNDGQFFFIWNIVNIYEKPSSETAKASILQWCSDLSFTDFHNNISSAGFAGRCVGMWLDNTHSKLTAAGAQQTYYVSAEDFTLTLGISAVFVEQLNMFQGQFHRNTDDFMICYWDDGRATLPYIGWESHDEGDVNPSAATSAFSGVGEVIWTSVEDVAKLLNTTAYEFTHVHFNKVCTDVWIKEHEEEAVVDNPNPEAELMIIEQVKNETSSGTEEIEEPAPTATANNIGNDDTEMGAKDDVSSTGTGRKVVSATSRLALATLRMFGI